MLEFVNIIHHYWPIFKLAFLASMQAVPYDMYIFSHVLLIISKGFFFFKSLQVVMSLAVN